MKTEAGALIAVITGLILVTPPALAAGEPGRARFESNRGQAAPGWAFLARTADGPLLLGEQGLRLGTSGLTLAGADPGAAWEGIEPLPGKAHYLLGADSERWIVDVPTFGAVVRRSAYPGIDLILRGTGRRLDLEFVVAPEADPGKIVLDLGEGVRVTSPLLNGEPGAFVASGNGLRIDVPRGSREAPLRIGVAVDLPDAVTVALEPPRLTADAKGNLVIAGRVAGDRATTSVIVLDPSGREVASTTYLDGFDLASPVALTVASTGDLVVAGAHAGDAVVVRVDPAGRKILHRSTIGGAGDDAALAVAADGEGNTWVAGRTTGLKAPGAGVDALVAKLDASGTVVFAPALGSAGADEARGIAFDRDGALYITGTLGPDALVAKIDPRVPSLVYSLAFGGTGEDEGAAIAVSDSGDIVLAGTTRSADLPGAGGGRATSAGISSAFLARLDPSGRTALFASYLGGPIEERAEALALDRHGRAWVAGSRGADAFVTQVSLEKRSVTRDATLAGELADVASGVVVDGNGDAHVAGLTASPDFHDAERPAAVRGGEVFVAKVATGERAPLGVCPSGKNFLGIEDNTWENADNWSNGILPSSADAVCIQGFNVVAGAAFRTPVPCAWRGAP